MITYLLFCIFVSHDFLIKAHLWWKCPASRVSFSSHAPVNYWSYEFTNIFNFGNTRETNKKSSSHLDKSEIESHVTAVIMMKGKTKKRVKITKVYMEVDLSMFIFSNNDSVWQLWSIYRLIVTRDIE